MVKWHKIIHPPATPKSYKGHTLALRQGRYYVGNHKVHVALQNKAWRGQVRASIFRLEHLEQIQAYQSLPVHSHPSISVKQFNNLWANMSVKNKTKTNSTKPLLVKKERISRSASTTRVESAPAIPGCEDGSHQALWMACSGSASGTRPEPPKMMFYHIAVGSAMRPGNVEVQQQRPEEESRKLP